jgi:hypothetical protein
MSVVMNMAFMLVLPVGVHVRRVRVAHGRMVVLVLMRGHQMFDLTPEPALTVMRNMRVPVAMNHRSVIVRLRC